MSAHADAAAEELRRSPLDGEHRRAGAKMVGFGGWEMPLSFGGGTIAEHMACRRAAAAFDVSHLGTVRVEGVDAYRRLQSTLTNDLAKIGPGRAQYTHLLDETDASVLDDLIVWWVTEERFDVMPNASNTTRVRDAVGGEDVTRSRAVIAVQGPEARARLARVAPDAAAVRRFGVTAFTWNGQACVAAGTGYTGEDGVECAIPAETAASFWAALIDSGIPPAGLGARDTLRLEAGLPLHGHELGPGITPLQAGLGWVVSWTKPEGFRGRDALEVERLSGPARLLTGLATEGRQPPRAGYRVIAGGSVLGEVTSGNFSPVLGHGIALTLLPTSRLDAEIRLEARARSMPAVVVPLPFVPRGEARATP